MTDTYPTFDRAQLVVRAIRILGSTPLAQEPEDDDKRAVDAHVLPLLARLNAEKVTYHLDAEGNVTQLDDPEAIPAKAFMDVAVLLADSAKQDFGLAALPMNDPALSEKRLRAVWSVDVTLEDFIVVDPDTGEETTEFRPETLAPGWF